MRKYAEQISISINQTVEEEKMKNKIYSFLVLFIVVFFTLNYFPKEALAEDMNRIQKSDNVVVVSNPKTPELKMRIVFKERC